MQKNNDALIDFSELDELFKQARQQISDHEFAQALDTIYEIKETDSRYQQRTS